MTRQRHRVAFSRPSAQNTHFHLFEDGSDETVCGMRIRNSDYFLVCDDGRYPGWTVCEFCTQRNTVEEGKRSLAEERRRELRNERNLAFAHSVVAREGKLL